MIYLPAYIFVSPARSTRAPPFFYLPLHPPTRHLLSLAPLLRLSPLRRLASPPQFSAAGEREVSSGVLQERGGAVEVQEYGTGLGLGGLFTGCRDDEKGTGYLCQMACWV